MKLLVKFNLLLIVVFGLGLFVIAYQARSFLQEQAQAEVLRQAGLMAASALATRNYTEHYITSIIEKTMLNDGASLTMLTYERDRGLERSSKSMRCGLIVSMERRPT